MTIQECSAQIRVEYAELGRLGNVLEARRSGALFECMSDSELLIIVYGLV
jgi:hypothetical protein